MIQFFHNDDPGKGISILTIREDGQRLLSCSPASRSGHRAVQQTKWMNKVKLVLLPGFRIKLANVGSVNTGGFTAPSGVCSAKDYSATRSY